MCTVPCRQCFLHMRFEARTYQRIRVGSSSGMNEKCQTSSSHVHTPSVHCSGSILVAEQLGAKERHCLAACVSEQTGVRRVHRHLKLVHSTHGRGTNGNDIIFGRTRVGHSGMCPLTPRAMIHGSMVTDGVNVIPSFDGTDFTQCERRVLLIVSSTRAAPERRAGNLLKLLEGRALDSCEGIQDLETSNGVENLLDDLVAHFEPIEVFRRGSIAGDLIYDFE